MVGWGNRSHEVSILIIEGIGLARFFGAPPGSKISMLKAIRDQARADTERAEGAIDRLGPTATTQFPPPRLQSFYVPQARAHEDDRTLRTSLHVT